VGGHGIVREMIDADLWIDGMRSIVHPHPPKDLLLELDDLPYAEPNIVTLLLPFCRALAARCWLKTPAERRGARGC